MQRGQEDDLFPHTCANNGQPRPDRDATWHAPSISHFLTERFNAQASKNVSSLYTLIDPVAGGPLILTEL